ncbi:MAG: shikimate dehydrogenase [Flavobacteriaceae bacterium]
MTKKHYGLLGKNISYSFSKKYFLEKFKNLKLNCVYNNFDIESIEFLPDLLNENITNLKGFNVTIPYKNDIFKYLDEIDETAQEINAVNCVKIIDQYYLKGFNTDAYGFENSLKPLLKPRHKKALILGTGGASKAVAFVLKKLNIAFTFVSRNPTTTNQISYETLTDEIIINHQIIINCTPLGTHPNIQLHPNINYLALTSKHLLYDLIYNPSETKFLTKGKNQSATIKNGLEMLELQAEKSWEIWNEEN